MTDVRTRRDAGFTLTEVLIVVTLMGVLALAIGGVFSIIVRTVPSTEARADDARSLLGLSAWLPGDVNSAPRIAAGTEDTDGASFDTRDVASGCSSGDDGENLLRLRWTEVYTSTRTYSVSYRLVERSSGHHIVRVACTNGGPATVVNMTAALPAPDSDFHPVGVTYRTVDGFVEGVVFEVHTFDDGLLRIDTVSQSPNETLPPLGTVVIDPTTTTAAPATTTTIAPSAAGICALIASDADVTALPVTDPATLRRDASTGDIGMLTAPATVTASIDLAVDQELATLDLAPDVCATLQLEYHTAPASPVVLPMNVSAACTATADTTEEPIVTNCVTLSVTATAVLPSHASEPWETGTHPAQLLGPGGTPIAGSATSFVVEVDPSTVAQPCVASFVSVSPSSVHNTNNANSNNTKNVTSGPLAESVTVTVNKGDNCANLGLEYLHDPPSTGWKPFGASSQVILQRNNQETWRDGPRVLRLVDGQGGPVVAQITLSIL